MKRAKQQVSIWAVFLTMVTTMRAQVTRPAQDPMPLVATITTGHGASPTAVPPLSNAYPAVIAQAIAAAQARINSSKKCRQFFNNQGIEIINQTHYSLQDLGQDNRAAQVMGFTVFLNVNPKGKFMDPPAEYAGLRSAAEIRGFYILHELGHELARYTRFVKDQSVSRTNSTFRHRANDELLRQNCY